MSDMCGGLIKNYCWVDKLFKWQGQITVGVYRISFKKDRYISTEAVIYPHINWLMLVGSGGVGIE